MNKKLMILSLSGLIFMAMFLTFLTLGAVMPERPERPERMMEHARFGIMLAEKNLFPAPMLLRHKDDIGLTTEQVSKIEKLQELHRESLIRKQADIDVKELKISTFLKEDKIDRAKMESLIREIGNMKTDLQIQHINQLLDIRELLSPDQLKKLDALKRSRLDERMENRRTRMKERLGRRGMEKEE